MCTCTQALLSRFDILFLLMDKVRADADFNLAKHVCHVHQYNNAPAVDMDEVFDAQFLRAYIAQAHRHQVNVAGVCEREAQTRGAERVREGVCVGTVLRS